MYCDCRRPDATHEMAETFGYHGLKGIGSTGGISCDHRVSCHDGRDRSRAGIQTISNNLLQAFKPLSTELFSISGQDTHPESQILSRKDTTQMFVFIDNQYAIRSLGSTELTGVRHADRIGYGQGR